MCLTEITQKYPQKDKSEGYGWKIVGIKTWYSKGEVDTPCYYVKLTPNKWIRRKISTVFSTNGREYQSGFHIFKTRKDARAHWLYNNNYSNNKKIIKVKYRGIVCEGIEKASTYEYIDENGNVVNNNDTCQCLVVKQIYIEK